MSDFYHALANSAVGKKVFSAMNLPIPVQLERFDPSETSFIKGAVLVGAAEDSTATDAIFASLKQAPAAQAHVLANGSSFAAIEAAAANTKQNLHTYMPAREDRAKFKALVFDATGIKNTTELNQIWAFFNPVIRKLDKCARVIVVGRTPETCELEQRIAQRGLLGLIKSLGKEIKNGATANLITVDAGAENQLNGALQFFLSPKSAYVSGQMVRLQPAEFDGAAFDWSQPLAGKTALVTGAARGIGAAIAETLARDGAKVVVLDIPAMSEDLQQVAAKLNGVALAVDITADDAPAQISAKAKELGGLDILVHNAGVTRDKTMAGMKDHLWDMVIDINISSEERINTKLLADGTLNKGGRIVGVSSISGIAGNMGQTNYATSKAAVIGMVEGMAPELAANDITINAVAPGFIETQMTDAIPFAIREAGRRMNSMNQGGQPVDVAEAIAFFASPAAQGASGNVVRVCGQSLLGA
ncbi:MAG TPA: 3-oxoacyl-ACP reductase [Alcanivoracaceae bacterium]|nr:3-oxoacyl-ACP reductase [Alcanivoracaceae bacterium]